MQVERLGKKPNILTSNADISQFTKIYFLRHKSEVIEELKAFCLEIENQINCKIKKIDSDEEKELKNKEVERFLISESRNEMTSQKYNGSRGGPVDAVFESKCIVVFMGRRHEHRGACH
jgi:hypothetical protein